MSLLKHIFHNSCETDDPVSRYSAPRRKKMAKRLIALSLAAGMILPLWGCSSSGQSSTVIDQTGRTKISFSWWGNDPRHQYTLKGLELFDEQHPDIAVSHYYGVWDGYERRYQIMMLSHSQADVMQVNYGWLKKYSPYGTGYYDLNSLAGVLDLSSYTEEDLKTGTVNQRLVAIPIAYNTTVLFFNKDIYDQYGLEIPSSWDELRDAAKVMSKDGIYPVGMIAKHLFLLLVARYEQMTGEKIFDEDGNYVADVEAIEEMLQEYKDMVDEKVFPPANEYDDAAFTNKELAGVACWVSDSSRYCNALIEEGVNVVVGDRLHSEDEYCSGWYMKPATMYAISRDAEDPEAAAVLLNFLVNDPGMAKLQGTEKGVPVSSKAKETLQEEGMINSMEYESSKMIRDNQEELEMMIPALEDADIQKAFIEASDKYIYEVEDLETASKELHDSFTSLTSQEGE